jgi:transposase
MDSETISISIAELNAFITFKAQLEKLEQESKKTKSAFNRTRTKLKRTKTALKEKCAEVNRLQKHIAKLARMLFGKRSEKFNPDQLRLAFEDWDKSELPKPDFPKDVLETPDEENEAPKKKRKPRGSVGRGKLPEHLERETIVIEPDEEELICECCHGPKSKTGEEKTEKLTYFPGHFKVQEIIRPKYACTQCWSGFTFAALPYQTIEKGMATGAYLAHLLVQKYGYHLPLDRQRQMLSEHGINLTTATLSNWVRQCADLLEPLVAEIEREVLMDEIVQFDETRIRVRDPTHNKNIRNGHLWLFCGRPGAVLCKASSTKSGELPKEVFAKYRGFVQADAAQPFDGVFASPDRVEVGCWAHARRYFEDAAKKGDQICQWTIMAIAKIFKTDKDVKKTGTLEDLIEARHKVSKPIVDRLFKWFNELKVTMIESDAYFDGVRYATNQEQALKEFLTNPRLELSNSRVERNMKRIAIGRRNWLFAGSPAGAERAATIYTIILSCQELGLNLWEYMDHVLKILPSTPKKQVWMLTPLEWKRHQSERE